MFPSIQTVVIDDHQRALRDEAARERLAAQARAGRARGAARPDSVVASWPSRLGGALAGRIGRFVAIGR